MTIHRIRLLGDPILRAKCEPITKPRSTAVRVILDDMRETLRDWQSRFGSGRAIAAPQIGAPVRMVYSEMDQPWALINPEIVDIGSEDFEVWDDCFSFPNLLVRVSRAHRVRVKYQDTKGEWHEVDLEGDRAELIQHEIDHLDGVLAVDRPAGPRSVLSPRRMAPAARPGRPLWPARGPEHQLRDAAHRPAVVSPAAVNAVRFPALPGERCLFPLEPATEPDEQRVAPFERQAVLESHGSDRRLGSHARRAPRQSTRRR